ncbi:MAG: translation elongation factor 4 [Ignavibacteriaceae bacterium]|jgi:GTP-binding protein LepA|nr:MAG: elongation factor 4 [Chlorobiota bacterium]KXK06048.1 MAG: GTP-binding protein LepA [Chlorobi bacterium OLB4]MBV6398483.1 Elongation factor 4 [Ignavibacteria bacterium]MCC6885717.1 elongation factor 4 [Ignavibacteriales bacterium]MCE7953088.1 elongation factor 4 [Chlorobi bacterium CHB7]MDL1887074.1 elongation factor 4 [Ignavibacteria bacterium CHB1]MEB2329129.1 translation elongation factor 4 [Ignavibacteriaceae bacterium]OQY77967.1 MAG: elongation factor 4 [Ignavibacteriales bacter
MTPNSNIRNFCIIAHIDHGKSTLADRLLEYTKTVESRVMTKQILDSMDLEQERGITIKLHAIQMNYRAKDGNEYILNLIDTPGHVDFSYEVSRSLAACEGALLVVDSTQGIEAQTISNLYLAIENGLEIIPVLNKIDLPSAMIDEVTSQVLELIGGEKDQIIPASAKTGVGTEEILEAIVKKIPPAPVNTDKPLRAMIFDSSFDNYRGVVVQIRVVEGELNEGDKIEFFSNNKRFIAEEVGVLKMQRLRTKSLRSGNVGYLIAGIKDVNDSRVGDTIFNANNRITEPLPGYKEVKPMVFSGIYPAQSEDFENLRESLSKLKLNDAALSFTPESSVALGFGFRCGFLGMLHMEIVQERLEREYDLNIVTTVPNVEYKVYLSDGGLVIVDNPSDMPEPARILRIEEPYIKAQIITPTEYIGNIMKLAQERRGNYITTQYIDTKRVDLQFEFPLSEIIFDFYDKLKSTSRGYASFDYDFVDYRESKLVKLDILLNGDPVDALSSIVHKDNAHDWGKKLCSKLRQLIPRQMFEVAIQAAIGSKIISRETISAIRKNVTAKCYGGDITRKRKLLEKQKEGKKRMKQVGAVEIPQEAFLAVLSIEK